MVHISMILDPGACIHDAANLSRTNRRTGMAILGVGYMMHISMMHVYIMYVSKMHVSMVHAYRMHVSLMRVSMMHISTIHISVMPVFTLRISMMNICFFDACMLL